jgi:hypothetical protein
MSLMIVTKYVIYADILLLPVYAGGVARDYDEKYDDIPGANECWYDGYLDGENNSYNHDRGDECKDRGGGSGQSSFLTYYLLFRQLLFWH